MMKEKPKKKILLKASIKIHQEVKEKIDKTTTIIGYVCVGIIVLLLIWLIIEIFTFKPTNIYPSNEEIKEFCEQKNMLPNGYAISYKEVTWLWIFKSKSREQVFINCKSKYPREITIIPEETMPECCYPPECPQAQNNPQYCNCIYLTYCTKISDAEYKQWTYRIIGKK